jgi:hypothetical protein
MEKWKTNTRFSTFPPPRFLLSLKKKNQSAGGLRPPAPAAALRAA